MPFSIPFDGSYYDTIIRIVKTDDLTGEAVSGAEFTITDESGNVAAVITTDAVVDAESRNG